LKKEKIILGIDPGTNLTGYGLLKVNGSKLEVLSLGIISLQKIKDPYLKLQRIFSRVLSLVDEFHPDELAIEAPFYGKNVQSMLKLGRAQGVAMAAALYRSVPIHEYAPRKIKMAITGQGNASKEQVAGMLVSILKLKELPDLPDATDGLAAAVCHHFQSLTPESGKSVKSWKEFINKNPGRVKS
jgi:crossover junction endodeoxyribonuclease RuvC